MDCSEIFFRDSNDVIGDLFWCRHRGVITPSFWVYGVGILVAIYYCGWGLLQSVNLF